MQAVGGWDSHLWGISMFGTPNVKKVESCGRGDVCDEKCEGDTISFKIECYSIQ